MKYIIWIFLSVSSWQPVGVPVDLVDCLRVQEALTATISIEANKESIEAVMCLPNGVKPKVFSKFHEGS